MVSVLVTGATGLIGSRLVDLLLSKGYQVGILSRKKVTLKNVRSFQWSSSKIDLEALIFADVIVHLAGANVGAKRWTNSWKREIISSRIDTAELIRETLVTNNLTIDAFISASAIGYYGEGGSQILDEETPVVESNFLSEVCEQWENKTKEFSSICRTASVRIGFVLDKKSQSFFKLTQPIKWGVGAALGSGKQYVSWIHLDDLTRIFLTVIKDKNLSGVINGCSSEPLTNIDLTKKIANKLKRPLFLPSIPELFLRILLGEMGDLALTSTRVISNKLEKRGFKFIYPTLDNALNEIY